MSHVLRPLSEAPKRATNVSISESLLADAKELQVNVSRAAEAGIAEEVARRRAAAWLEENKPALDSSNAYVEKNGLPLARFRPY